MSDLVAADVDGVINAPIEAVWRLMADLSPAEVFKGKGPLPAVRNVTDQTGPWDTLGQTRTVLMSDGMRLFERVTVAEPPDAGLARLVYEVRDYTGPIGLLASEGISDITFADVGGQTRLHWNYGFRPKSGLTRVPLNAIRVLFWQGYVRDVFEDVKTRAEGEAA